MTNNTIELNKIHFDKADIEKMLILSCIFSIGLVVMRVICTSQLMYVWLIWNLFLACVPYIITRSAIRKQAWVEGNKNFFIITISWLLFLPNSFYIITDLFHLRYRQPVPLWFDLALILSFVWNGLLLGILSLRQMEKMIASKFVLKSEWLFICPVMLLNAFGIYVGRYLRYNSWDILSNPFQLFSDIASLIIHPFRNLSDWSMVLCYAIFITLIYSTIKKMGRIF